MVSVSRAWRIGRREDITHAPSGAPLPGYLANIREDRGARSAVAGARLRHGCRSLCIIWSLCGRRWLIRRATASARFRLMWARHDGGGPPDAARLALARRARRTDRPTNAPHAADDVVATTDKAHAPRAQAHWTVDRCA